MLVKTDTVKSRQPVNSFRRHRPLTQQNNNNLERFLVCGTRANPLCTTRGVAWARGKTSCWTVFAMVPVTPVLYCPSFCHFVSTSEVFTPKYMYPDAFQQIPLTHTHISYIFIVALGQVMTRLQNVRWIALPSSPRRPRDAFRIAIILTMFWITVNCLIYYLEVLVVTKIILFVTINFVLYLYYLANVIRTRLRLRRRFNISPLKKGEDMTVGGLVPLLCVMQMLRHTCDYDNLAGYCFTATGVASHIKLHMPLSDDDDCSLSTNTMSVPLR